MTRTNFHQVLGEALTAFAGSVERLFFVNQAVGTHVQHAQQQLMCTLLFIAVALVVWLAAHFRNRFAVTRKISTNQPPALRGRLPVIGNLLQLGSTKPRTLTDISESYGPIFQLQLGALKYVVLTSPELAKEAAVTKFQYISKRHVLSNLNVWSKNKNMVALADYGEEYRKLKTLLVGQVLRAPAQKSLSPLREQLLKEAVDAVFSKVLLKGSPGVVNVRDSIEHYLFPFLMHQIMGYVPESVYVESLGNLVLRDIFDHLVVNPMHSVTTVDWRDFLPFLRWIPNPTFKRKVVDVEKVRSLVVQALIKQKRKLLQQQGPKGGFLEHMLTVETNLSSLHVELLTWEPIIEGTDTSLVTMEWAMYELAKNPDIQSRLYEEIEKVVGNRTVTESDLANLPLLDAIFKETLRVYSPIMILPPREIEEDITIGGYDIPKGWNVLINVYGINNDKKRWASWDKWIPDRFLNAPDLDMGVKDFQLIPFGLGKRRCSGALQATTVVCSFIARFVQQFHWSLPPQHESYIEKTGYLTTQKLHPLEAIARPRAR